MAFLALFFALRNERVRRLLVCPTRHESADVEIVQRYLRPDKPLKVKACSLLSGHKTIDCSQACIRQTA
jgi:hypothetical protein